MAKVSDSTESTKAFLAEITGTDAADWKRTKKEKVDGDVHRTLNHQDGKVAVVRYRDGSKEPFVSGYTIVSLSPPAVHRFEAQKRDDYTGKVIFYKVDDDEQDEESLVFMCGQEVKGGYIDDQHNPKLDRTLKAALISAGFDEARLDISAAESYHMVDLEGEERDDVWQKVKGALLGAGAVEDVS